MTNEAAITRVKTASREEWRKLRSGYIGGSDAAAVVGPNPYASAYSLWAEKTGRTAGFAGNLATEVGTYLEEFVAKKFEQATGKKVRRCNQSILNSLYPWAIANIDREIVGEDAGLEIKTTDSLNLKKFSGGEYPANYYVQCVHYLAVTGKARWYLAVLIGNREFRHFTIERDEGEIAALMDAENDLWQRVKNNTPPDADGSQATTEAIKTIYAGGCDGAVCDLYPQRRDIEQYMAVSARIKELETAREEAANRIKAYMGNMTGGEWDRFRVTWKPQSRSTFDCKRFAQDNPNIDISAYYKTTTARIFRVNENKGE